MDKDTRALAEKLASLPLAKLKAIKLFLDLYDCGFIAPDADKEAIFGDAVKLFEEPQPKTPHKSSFTCVN